MRTVMKQKRIDLGLTQAQLSVMIGVSQAKLSIMENGSMPIQDREKIKILCAVLSIRDSNHLQLANDIYSIVTENKNASSVT